MSYAIIKLVCFSVVVPPQRVERERETKTEKYMMRKSKKKNKPGGDRREEAKQSNDQRILRRACLFFLKLRDGKAIQREHKHLLENRELDNEERIMFVK